MEELYKGFVVELYSKETKKGKDFIAIVYERYNEEFIHYKYANQDTYLPNNAWIDAEKWVVDLYEKELKKRELEYLKLLLKIRNSYKGLTLKVVRGKKTPLGTKGYCIWSGMSKYGQMRVGIKDEQKEVHWTSASNCEIDDGD